MNWFGLFTMAMIVVLIAWGLAYGYGYEQAEKDWTMSKEWLDRLEMENRNWSSEEAQQFLRSRNNHPTNKDWN